jgi:hypothetical protein
VWDRGICEVERRRTNLQISTADISSSDASAITYPRSSTLPVTTANAAANTIPTSTLRLLKAPPMPVAIASGDPKGRSPAMMIRWFLWEISAPRECLSAEHLGKSFQNETCFKNET